MTRVRTMSPHLPVTVGDGLFHADVTQPIGLWVSGGRETFVTWADATIPSVAFQSEVFPSDRGAWIAYSPYAIHLHPDPAPFRTAAYVEPDGLKLSVKLGSAYAMGPDARGLWSGSEASNGTLLTRHNLDGTELRVTFDKQVESISSLPDGVRIMFTPAPPVEVPEDGGFSYQHSLASVDVPELRLSDGHLRSADFERTRLSDDRFGSSDFDHALLARSARQRLLHRPEIPTDLAAEWPTIDRDQVDVEAVIAEALRQFQEFEADHWQPSSDPVSNPSLEVRGEWPEMDLVVHFDFHRYPGPRFRYVLPLFTQGGRPALSEYESIDFVEDLHTKRLFLSTSQVGDVIDF